jgi:hypothetical protein
MYREITSSLNQASSHPEFQEFVKSLSVNSLLHKSVEYFVGSPSNQPLI